MSVHRLFLLGCRGVASRVRGFIRAVHELDPALAAIALAEASGASIGMLSVISPEARTWQRREAKALANESRNIAGRRQTGMKIAGAWRAPLRRCFGN